MMSFMSVVVRMRGDSTDARAADRASCSSSQVLLAYIVIITLLLVGAGRLVVAISSNKTIRHAARA
jgi:hypothetical protein